MLTKSRTRSADGPTWALRCLAAFLCATLVLAQSSYACAGGSGTQIEICSGDGVALIRVDADGNAVEGGGMSPADCDACKFCATQAASQFTASHETARPSPGPVASNWPAQWHGAAASRQLWPEVRGPPARSVVSPVSLVALSPIASEFARRAPWM